MDIYTFIVLLHVVGTILGTGGATLAELQITRALADKKVSPDERALMHVNYGLIRVGMATLLVSVLGMYWYFAMQGSNVLFTSEKLWIKELMFAAIFINALALQKRWVPLWLGASISFTSWWGATLLGLAGQLPYSFTTYLLGYLAAILLVAGLSKYIRKAAERGLLTKRRKVTLVATVLIVILLLIYGVIRNEKMAREAREQAQAMTPAVAYRTLQETVVFDYPAGTHNVVFTFELDDAGVIASITAADTDPENQGKFPEFTVAVSELVVGKTLSELTPLSRVGGASLTTAAFNEAVAKLQAAESTTL
jgi:hypothetical protein